MTQSLTPSSLKDLNYRRVLDALYEQRETSKQNLSHTLNMSLPTVTQNLLELERQGLVERKGHFQSTGGRKAQIYQFAATARIAIGVLLLKECYYIVAVDLYGKTLCSRERFTPLSRTEAYFRQLGREINSFAADLPCRPEQILGVSIAIQGIVSPSGDCLLYGEVIHCTGLKLDEVQCYVNYPCRFLHDTEATAMAELWNYPELKDVALFVLSRNFGGVLIINRELHRGRDLCAMIEHMCLHPEGHPCYCGKRGCIETYCSGDALLREAGEPLERFFWGLRAGDIRRQKIWQTYLKNLALAMNNVRMVVDLEYVVSGYLLKFMTNEDFETLTQYVNELCFFQPAKIRIHRSVYVENVAACGAAISLAKEFLASL